MSTPINPPAFPYAFDLPSLPGEPSGISLGMTLRDWFAGQALQGALSAFSEKDLERFAKWSNAERAEKFAADAYLVANAMLAARAASASSARKEQP